MPLVGNTNVTSYIKADREAFIDEILSATNTDFNSAYQFFLDDLKSGRVDEEWNVQVLDSHKGKEIEPLARRVTYTFPKNPDFKPVIQITSDPNYQFCSVEINLWAMKNQNVTNAEAKTFIVQASAKGNALKDNYFFEDLCARAKNREQVLQSLERGKKYAQDLELSLNDYKTSRKELKSELEKENASLKEQIQTLNTQFAEMKELMFSQMNSSKFEFGISKGKTKESSKDDSVFSVPKKSSKKENLSE